MSLVAVSGSAARGESPPGTGRRGIPASAAPSSAQEEDRGTLASLTVRARDRGSVRVIVGLRGAYPREAQLAGPGAVARQRAAIGRAQDAVLGELAGRSVTAVRRFRFVPFLAAEVDADGLAVLAVSPGVSSIQEDVAEPPALAESVPLIGATAAWGAGHSGTGWAVAVLDTGVDKTHGFLAGKVVEEACYSTTFAPLSTSVCPGGAAASTSTGSGVPCGVDGCEHGTHVAGIVAGRGASPGVARDADVIAIQVFSRFDDPLDCGSDPAPCVLSFRSDQIAALERVYDLRGSLAIAAVNMSLGGGTPAVTCDGDPRKPIIDDLRAAGIATVVSSGNGAATAGLSAPACVSTAVGVGSTGDGSQGAAVDVVSAFSNSATSLPLLAPGEWITSSVPGGGFEIRRGTSMAAPHVAGAWAVLKSAAPAAGVDEVLAALTSTGLGILDPRNGVTTPRLRVDAAVSTLLSSSYALSATTLSVGASAGSTSVGVTAPAGCGWTVTSAATWITVTSGSSGSGNGAVGLTVAPNPDAARTGTVAIADQTFTVTQAGPPACSYSVSPLSPSVGSGAAAGSIAVTAAFGCAWTASSGAGWLTITGGGTGTGTGSVSYAVAPNPGALPRMGTLTVAGRIVSVTQAGAPCGYTLSVTSQTFGPAGGTATVSVTANAGCAWTATTAATWITIVSAATGSGAGSVAFTVDPNIELSSRTSTVLIAGQTLPVTQSPVGCTITIAPTIAAVGLGGGSGSLSVTAPSSCGWSATSRADWIAITSGGTGVGDGIITYAADPAPPLTTSRSGTLTIDGQNVEVIQSSVPTLMVTEPTSATAFSARSPFLRLAGVAAGSAGIDAVTWSNDRGGSGTATGTTSWVARRIPLKSGINTVTVTATGTASPSRGSVVDPPVASTTSVILAVTVESFVYNLAEGATGTFFDLELALANLNPEAAPVTLTFLKSDGTTVNHSLTLLPTSRKTVDVEAIAGLESTALSTVVESPAALPLVVERSMFWDDTSYGGHGAAAVSDARKRWYFAEGAQGFFDTYLLLANGNATAASVNVTFLRETDPPFVKLLTLEPTSRRTAVAGDIPQLVGKSFSMVVESDQPVFAERAMYFGGPQPWRGGHVSPGANETATSWFHAEGATGDLFDTFVLVANPNAGEASVTFTYLLGDGTTVERIHMVPGWSRLTVDVEGEAASLSEAAVSTTVTSDLPIVSERAMYWPGGATSWTEAHDSLGLLETSAKWGVGEGRVGGTRGFHTYILLANPGSEAAPVTITFLKEGGGTIVKAFTVAPRSRFTVHVNSMVSELVNETFGAYILKCRQ